MDDFWRFERRTENFPNDMYRPSFDPSPFSIFQNSMQQMHREMDNMMRHAFTNFVNFPTDPFGDYQFQQPSIDMPQKHSSVIESIDKDLDKQVQKYGLNSVFDDNYSSEWDFVKQLEQLEKEPNKFIQKNPNSGARFYGRSHFHTYSTTSDGKVEERKVIQDTRGNRMESMQRKLGERVWAKTIKQNDKGEVNEDEKLYGMDDRDKERFMSDWKSTNAHLPSIQHHNTNAKDYHTQSNISTDNHNVPTQFTLPSSDQKNENQGWLNKLKFWKK